MWKNACLNHREFDLEGDLLGVPPTWYLSDTSIITLSKLEENQKRWLWIIENRNVSVCTGHELALRSFQFHWSDWRTELRHRQAKLLFPSRSVGQIGEIASLALTICLVQTRRRTVQPETWGLTNCLCCKKLRYCRGEDCDGDWFPQGQFTFKNSKNYILLDLQKKLSRWPFLLLHVQTHSPGVRKIKFQGVPELYDCVKIINFSA